MKEKILVLGAGGQIGVELVQELKKNYGSENVIASDIRELSGIGVEFELLDVMDTKKLYAVVKKHNITTVYLLAAFLSVTAEQNPKLAWSLNVNSLLSVLDMAKGGLINKVFFPSSISVFGDLADKENTGQESVRNPLTVYGISKVAGEMWCEYYCKKYGVDVRGIRYPGLIGSKSLPGGGTTDYAVDIYYKALEEKVFNCFLSPKTVLPMMFMPDAIRATIELMSSQNQLLKKGKTYNISAMSFSPEQIAEEITKHIPTFRIKYSPDFRQKIADNWPRYVDDSHAQKEWDWHYEFNLAEMTQSMIRELKKAAK